MPNRQRDADGRARPPMLPLYDQAVPEWAVVQKSEQASLTRDREHWPALGACPNVETRRAEALG